LPGLPGSLRKKDYGDLSQSQNKAVVQSANSSTAVLAPPVKQQDLNIQSVSAGKQSDQGGAIGGGVGAALGIMTSGGIFGPLGAAVGATIGNAAEGVTGASAKKSANGAAIGSLVGTVPAVLTGLGMIGASIPLSILLGTSTLTITQLIPAALRTTFAPIINLAGSTLSLAVGLGGSALGALTIAGGAIYTGLCALGGAIGTGIYNLIKGKK